MAKTKKHEMSKEELRAPDPFQAWLERVWAFLSKHRRTLILAVVAVVVGGTVIWIMSNARTGSRNAESLALRTALAPIGAHVGVGEPAPAPGDPTAPVPAPVPTGPSFADEKARVAAAETALTTYLQAHGSSGAAELVTLTQANLKLEKGDAAGALELVTKWRAEHASSAANPIALELSARARLAKGERDLAAREYEALAAAVGGAFKADAFVRLGDLQNPVLNQGAGDATKAKAAYQQALAALPKLSAAPDEGDAPAGARGEIKSKLELLD